MNYSRHGFGKSFCRFCNIKERVNRINSLYNFIDLFDGGIFSHEVGIRKPNPQIYKLLLDKAHLKAEEVVFIDDKEINSFPA